MGWLLSVSLRSTLPACGPSTWPTADQIPTALQRSRQHLTHPGCSADGHPVSHPISRSQFLADYWPFSLSSTCFLQTISLDLKMENQMCSRWLFEGKREDSFLQLDNVYHRCWDWPSHSNLNICVLFLKFLQTWMHDVRYHNYYDHFSGEYWGRAPRPTLMMTTCGFCLLMLSSLRDSQMDALRTHERVSRFLST